MRRALNYASLCSGIESASVAWAPLGRRPLFVSEIDPFGRDVLAVRLPGVPDLGDMTAPDFCDRARSAIAARGVNILVAGTPCQAFSVGGSRKSLDDDRGNLTLRFVEIADELDPAWIVWENVPGVLSLDDNTFGHLLAGLVGHDEPLTPCTRDGGKKWPNAGVVVGPRRAACRRILDAQYFGLAQRRRRVFIVARRAGNGSDCAAVLLEPESLPRDPPPRPKARAGVARNVTPRARSGGGDGVGDRTFIGDDGPLNAPAGDVARAVTNSVQRGDMSVETFVAGTLPASYGDQGGNAPGEMAGGVIAYPPRTRPQSAHDESLATYIAHGRPARYDSSADGTGRGIPLVASADPISATLCGSSGGKNDLARLGSLVGEPEQEQRAYQCQGGNVGPMGTLRGTADASSGVPFMADQPPIAFDTRQDPMSSKEIAGPVAAAHPCQAVCSPSNPQSAIRNPQLMVRRLTPRECERLQGFRDDWTRIARKGKEEQECPDGPRYRTVGNAMPIPVMRWIGRRIAQIDGFLTSNLSPLT